MISSNTDENIGQVFDKTQFILEIVGLESTFYLLAFINRKFKQMFVQRVPHGKFDMLRILERMRDSLTFLSQKSTSTEPQVKGLLYQFQRLPLKNAVALKSLTCFLFQSNQE